MKTVSTIFAALKTLFRTGNYWKLVALGLIVSIIGLLFGVAFWLLFVGLFSLLHRWTPYWRPADKLFGKLSLANNDVQQPLKGWPFVQFILNSIPPLLLMLGGIYILIRSGFENQNLILMLVRK
jgi:hypothetical protein